MILNSNTPFGNINSRGEGAVITPHVLLWRCVIVRAIMDGLDVDIHAWGNARENIVKYAIAWFYLKEPHFCLACEYANLEPSFIIKRFKQLIEKDLMLITILKSDSLNINLEKILREEYLLSRPNEIIYKIEK